MDGARHRRPFSGARLLASTSRGVTDARATPAAARMRIGRPSTPLSRSSLPTRSEQSSACDPPWPSLRPGQEPSRLAAQAREGARGRPGRALARPRPLRRDRRPAAPLLVALAPHVAGWLKDALAAVAALRRRPGAARRRDDDAAARLDDDAALGVVVPFGLAMVAVAVASALAMGGWTWTFKPLGPRFDALDPLAGLGRVFSKRAADRRAEGERARAGARHDRRVLAVAPRRRVRRRAGAAAAGGDRRGRRRDASAGWA